jgi:hypothetical protein
VEAEDTDMARIRRERPESRQEFFDELGPFVRNPLAEMLAEDRSRLFEACPPDFRMRFHDDLRRELLEDLQVRVAPLRRLGPCRGPPSRVVWRRAARGIFVPHGRRLNIRPVAHGSLLHSVLMS